jgi:SagB-type dehydrogenase family enzyme
MTGDLSLVTRYRSVAQGGNGPARPIAGFLSPKWYPAARRVDLPWPGRAGGDELGHLGAVFLGYALVRLSLYTQAGLAFAAGRWPATGEPGRSRLIPTPVRPVPSGGASYPAELYLATAGSPVLDAGLYHYNPVRHALEAVAAGDVRGRIATASGDLIVIACRPWKNVQKYGDFYYRLSSVDIGALLSRFIVDGTATRVHLLHDDAEVAAALGTDPRLETAYAVLELAGSERAPGSTVPGSTAPGSTALVGAGLEIDRAGADLVHPDAMALHRASGTVAARPTPPEPADAVTGAATGQGDVVAGLRLSRTAALDLRPHLLTRQSVDGFQRGGVRVEQLAAVLASAAGGEPGGTGGAGLRVPNDLPAALAEPLTLYCVVPEAPGVPPGAYRYRPADRMLVRCGWPDAASAVVDAHPHARPALTNAVSVFVVGSFQSGVETLGPRWYRVLNMLAGVAVQRLYLAAAAVGLSARALLGYDIAAVDTLLDLPPGHTALVEVLIGAAAPSPTNLSLMLL